MDKKEKQKIYYEKNKERIKKANLDYYYKHQKQRNNISNFPSSVLCLINCNNKI